MLKFQPKAGSVVYCDYSGCVKPEMVKRRPVIIVAKHKHHPKLVYVVPISATDPVPVYNYHLSMKSLFCNQYLGARKSWVKCDMLNIISINRLSKFGSQNGGYIPYIDEDFLSKIKEGVKNATGM